MQIQLKTFIVTGGGSGLGEASCRYLVKAGANVIIFDRDETGGEKTATLLKGAAAFVRGDVTSEHDVLKAIRKSKEIWPKRTLGGVLNCAGVASAGRIVSSKGVPFDQDVFEMVFKVNVFGTFNVSRLVAAALQKNEPEESGERGVIINGKWRAFRRFVPFCSCAGFFPLTSDDAPFHSILNLLSRWSNRSVRLCELQRCHCFLDTSDCT